MLRHKVRQWFFEAVRLDMEAPQDLRETLLRGHPRLDGFIDRICEQIKQAEGICLRKGLVVKEKNLQDLTYDLTKYFMKGLQGEAEKRYESDIKKAAREAEAAKVKEFEAVLSGSAEGEFAEAGVITNEKIDKEREDYLEAQDKKAKDSFTPT